MTVHKNRILKPISYPWAVQLASILLVVACGAKDAAKEAESPTTDATPSASSSPLPAGSLAVQIATPDQLPLTVGKVYNGEPGGTATASAGTLAIPSAALTASSTGIPLGPLPGHSVQEDNTDGGLQQAYAAKQKSKNSWSGCESARVTKGFLQDAAASDQMFCILRFFASKKNGLYDGNDHITSVAMNMGGQQDTYKFKFKIDKSGDYVTGSRFYTCSNGKQQSYTRATINGTTYSQRSINLGGEIDAPPSVEISVTTVSGKLAADGKFVGEKTITVERRNDFSNNGAGAVDGHSKSVVKQSPNAIAFNRYYRNAASFEAGQNGHRLLAKFQLIDSNSESSPYSLAKLAIGDGSMLYATSDSNSVKTQSWNGDTWEIATSNDFTSSVATDQSNMLPFPTSVATLALAADETWDCSGASEFDFSPSQQEAEQMMQACGGFMLNQGYTDCKAVTTEP